MEKLFDEAKYDNVTLFDMKRDPKVLEMLDERVTSKSNQFLSSRKKGDFEVAFDEFCRYCDIEIEGSRYVYFFDFDFKFYTGIQNITPDYDSFLTRGLSDLLYTDSECTNDFTKRYNDTIESLIILSKRIADKALKAGKDNIATWFQNMRDCRAASFDEAIQRVLFLNQMMWQTGSGLVGLGRLDALLYPFYVDDINNSGITEQDAETYLADAFAQLHRYTWFKSGVILGDIGQVMVLGGLSYQNEQYTENELTHMIIRIITKSSITDPKIVLRVGRNMPRELMEEAVRCMATGVGSPLLANDDVIIPILKEFGVDPMDAYEYSTSACWETLIGGSSSSMNNQESISFTSALYQMLEEEPIFRLDSFDDIVKYYKRNLKREIKRCKRNLLRQRYDRNTLYSVFIKGCKESKKDIVDGGAKYHNIGVTTVGLGNTVNALMNIKKLVFEQHKYSMGDVRMMCLLNYENNEHVIKELKDNKLCFGFDEEEVIELTKQLLSEVSEETKDFETNIGGKLKFGMSSPAYIIAGERERASFDGRKDGDPLIVHISNEKADSYTSVMNFASSMDYHGNRFNGNVIDLMVSPSFIDGHFNKFVDLLQKGIETGIFELQANVLRSDTLINAKEHPDEYPNLIVRVWGFSALFSELPESYQDLLIARAIEKEKHIA